MNESSTMAFHPRAISELLPMDLMCVSPGEWSAETIMVVAG